MENMEISKSFWNNKKVLITGNSGFKGSWLTLILHMLGAKLYGYSLKNSDKNSIFNILNVQKKIDKYQIGDIRNYEALEKFILKIEPDIIFHLAAQPILIESYLNPLDTFTTNVVGTVNILNSVVKSVSVKCVVNITTDKCYELKEYSDLPFKENDLIGGLDPYSSSKSCSELVSKAYRSSFLEERSVSVSTARAGNIIGGGDWGEYRLIPDIIKSIINQKKLIIRSPDSTRPWQHVLEPLTGYLKLAEKSFNSPEFSQPWNFGPSNEKNATVLDILKYFNKKFSNLDWDIIDNEYRETKYLNLDISKANKELNWFPKLSISETLDLTIDWYETWLKKENIYQITIDQIENYLGLA